MGESRPKMDDERFDWFRDLDFTKVTWSEWCECCFEAERARASEADGIKAAEMAVEALGNARASLNAYGHDTDETHVFQMAEADSALAALCSFLAKAKGEG